MKYTFSDFKTWIHGKRVGLAGVGISNSPLIDLLDSCGATIVARDKKVPEENILNKLKSVEAEIFTGEDYLKDITEDIVIKSPGIRPDLEEFKNVAVLTNEMQLFFDVCPAKIIAVTGSDGKTTTTTLISEILKKAGYNVWLGGNIGTPLFCKTESITENDVVVLELSSFQLMSMTSSPDICIITNVSPNHLDWHTDFEEYVVAKKNIFKFSDNSIVVLNKDNEITRKMADELSEERVRFFSRKEDAVDEAICVRGKKILNRSDIFIPGEHNVENFQAAIAATLDFVLPEHVISVAREFRGVPHRCEFVREKDGVKYYNSSIDSSPSRTIAAVGVFKSKIIAICGGYDKNLDYSPLADVFAQKLKVLILTGATSQKIYDAVVKVDHDYPIYFEKDLASAVKKAHDISTSGDTVVLTPASASFDAFKNFEHRGNFFKEQVNNLE
ncbi:MAG: UDP-N-acetylmuramoyl-L-alanine--D-glutamate ligase [Ruminococcaceae bacterium]|nr:UDP-N-acetylmuramoyl-L-alanine--D-glutamate ligase [Oscillospiraceae bacterium]